MIVNTDIVTCMLVVYVSRSRHGRRCLRCMAHTTPSVVALVEYLQYIPSSSVNAERLL